MSTFIELGKLKLENLRIKAENRTEVGKGSSRRMRRSGFFPGIVYGNGEPQKIKINHNNMLRCLQDPEFYSNILTLEIESSEEKVFLKSLSRHPSKKQILHVDFQRINEDAEISIKVPIKLINEDKCIGVRMGGGVVSRLLNEVEILCLPKNLPASIDIDIENIEAGQSIPIGELNLPEGVRIATLAKGGDPSISVVRVSTPKGAMEEEDAEITGADSSVEDSQEGDNSDSG